MSADKQLPANEPFHDESDVFERCMSEILAGRSTIRDCARRYPHLPDLGVLLETALRAHHLPQPIMPADARERLRMEMLGKHRTLYQAPESAPAPAPARHVLPLLRQILRPALAFTIIICLFLFGGTLLVQAANSTVPGDALYGLKRAVEYAELALAEPQARPALLKRLARVRLDEVKTLRERGQSVPDAAILEAAEQINDALLQAVSDEERRALYVDTVQELQRAVDAGQADLSIARAAVGTLNVPAEVRQMVTLSAPSGGDEAGGSASVPPSQPPATPTVAVATATPEPTRTPRPTRTLRPTDEPEPTRTARPTRTVRPTDEPEPTRTVRPTDEPEPTRTPRPTRTLRPTDEPEPTRTPRPTRTLRPTDEPQPTRTLHPTRTMRPTDEPEPTRTPRPTRTVRPTDEPQPTRTPRPSGNSGNNGNQGNAGNQGNSGNQGNQGNQGNSGNQGNQGRDK